MLRTARLLVLLLCTYAFIVLVRHYLTHDGSLFDFSDDGLTRLFGLGVSALGVAVLAAKMVRSVSHAASDKSVSSSSRRLGDVRATLLLAWQRRPEVVSLYIVFSISLFILIIFVWH
jgi:hypothetical protein